MKAAKVFVLPSSREGFGIVVIEANACGLPVITVNETANAAVALIKEGINGAIVALEVKAIATKIDALCERPKKDYAKLVSLFSWDYFSAMISHEYSL
jgi:glycosyltransferase involved in cell wall biosynthesis